MRKNRTLLVFVLVLSILSTTVLPTYNTATAASYSSTPKPTVKLNMESLTMDIGQTYTLKLTSTTRKATWKSNNTKVVTVNNSGFVTAIKVGTATVTATIDKKKYKCKVTVEENSYVTDAPFEAQTGNFGVFSYVYPTDWESDTEGVSANTTGSLYLYPSSSDINSNSAVTLNYEDIGEEVPDYSIIKPTISNIFTADLVKATMKNQGIDVTITDFQSSDYETDLGTAYKISYGVSYKEANIEINLYQSMYILYTGHYVIIITETDLGDSTSDEVQQVAEYLLNSLQILEK